MRSALHRRGTRGPLSGVPVLRIEAAGAPGACGGSIPTEIRVTFSVFSLACAASESQAVESSPILAPNAPLRLSRRKMKPVSLAATPGRFARVRRVRVSAADCSGSTLHGLDVPGSSGTRGCSRHRGRGKKIGVSPWLCLIGSK
jgi:hypothetical protein